MKKTDLAYAAGIVDGEGCIKISHRHSKTCNRGYQLELVVTVSNCEEWLPQWFKFAFGGCLFYRNRNKKNPKWRDAWDWQICANQACAFLKLILPYLHLKRPQAEIAIKFQETKRVRGYGRHGLSDEAFAIEEAQQILLHKMKGRKD